MKNKHFFFIVFGFLIFHFLMTVVYVIPKKYFSKSLETLSKWYMAPQFDQAWDLFAPNPPLQEKTMLYRVNRAGQWSDWINPGAPLLAEHDAFRLSNASILYRINQNAAFHLWQASYDASNLKEKEVMFNENAYLKKSFGFRVASYYCWQKEAKSSDFISIDSLELKLVISTPPAKWNQEAWKHIELFFPVYYGK